MSVETQCGVALRALTEDECRSGRLIGIGEAAGNLVMVHPITQGRVNHKLQIISNQLDVRIMCVHYGIAHWPAQWC